MFFVIYCRARRGTICTVDFDGKASVEVTPPRVLAWLVLCVFARAMTARGIGVYGDLTTFAGSNSKLRSPGVGFRYEVIDTKLSPPATISKRMRA